MMKKAIILSILTFAVVSLSACGSDVEQAQEIIKESAKNQVQEKVQQVKQNADGVVTGTIKDLMAMGQKQKCTWETPEAKGVVYVDGNKIRTNITMLKVEENIPEEMKNMEINTIDDGQWMYTWNEGSDTGTKMKSEVIDELGDDMTETEVDMPVEDNMIDDMMDEQAMNYKCVKWTGDKSQFIPPKNVKFQDMGAMMQNLSGTMQQNMGNSNGNVENACAMAPTPEEKAKCLEEMAEMKKQMQDMQNVPQ
jgi:hypothetical protein